MIQSFADDTTADIFRERSTRAARRMPRDLWRMAQRKLKMVDVAARVNDLESPPGNRPLRLARVLKTSAQFWMRLQADWDLRQAMTRADKAS